MDVGDVIAGRFVLERRIGAGGMGTVFAARDRDSGETVAVKTLTDKTEFAADRFEREATVLAELDHPGIVHYVASGKTDSGEPYLAMGWVDGVDLALRLEHGPLSVSEVLALSERIASALGAAHARGVVHRDVKPANIILPGGRVEQAKLVDFGIARGGARSFATATGVVVGTIGYIAPEQARGDRDVDARADIFSLGCVLFECLTGRQPFVGDHAIAVLAKILIEEAPRVRELLPSVAPGVDDLVARMLSKNRDARPRDGAAVAGELSTLSVAAAPTLAAAAGPSERRLTHGEQRFVSVVLVSRSDAQSQTVAAEVVQSAAFGGRAEQLADGSQLFVFADVAATDQALNAARCALALRPAHPDCAIAIATGRGSLSSRLPVGEALDRAATLLTQARAGTIAIDPTTVALLGDRVDVMDGVLRAERSSSGAARTLLGKRTKCVGRDRELRMLAALADECFETRTAGVALISAPAGMGKTRVRQELLERLHAAYPDLEEWTAAADPLTVGSPGAMLTQLVRAACGIVGHEASAERLELVRRIAPSDAVPFLTELLGAPLPDDASRELAAARRDPQRMLENIRRAFVALASRTASARPLMIVLDDVHWCDRVTLEHVDALLALEETRLLVLALGRPEVHERFPSLWRTRSVQEVRIAELPTRACTALVREALGDAVDDALVTRVVERAAGNAFFLEELVRGVAEHADVETLPDTVLAMAQTRFAGLDDATRRALRAASTFGEVFWRSGVTALVGGDPDKALSTLTEREIIVRHRETRYAGDPEFAFRHALAQQAAYATLTDDDRRLAHALAGTWVEARPDADPRVIAQHYEHGAHDEAGWLRAAGWWEKAGRRSADAWSPEEAMEQWQRALTLLERVQASRERDVVELEVVLDMATLTITRDTCAPEVERRFLRARDIAGRVGDVMKGLHALYGLRAHYLFRGEFAQLESIMRQCSAVAPDDDVYRLEATRSLWNYHWWRGEIRRARERVDEGLALLGHLRERVPLFVLSVADTNCRIFDALTLATLGHEDEALSAFDALVADTRKLDHVYTMEFVLASGALAALITDDMTRLTLWAGEAYAFATTRKLTYFELGMRVFLVFASAAPGPRELDVMMATLERMYETRAWQGLTFLSATAAEKALVARRLDDARRCIAIGREVESKGGRFGSAVLVAVEAKLAWASTHDATTTERLFGDATSIAREGGAVAWEERIARDHAAWHRLR